MICQKCQCKASKILDQTVISYGAMIKRRRECKQCKFRWTTIECESATSEEVLKQAYRITRAYEHMKKALGDDS